MWEMNYESAANHWVEKDKDSVHMEVGFGSRQHLEA